MTRLTDNAQLMEYQRAFKEEGDRDALSKMYLLGRDVALRFIEAQVKDNRHVAELCQSDRQEKAHNAITYIIERYFRAPGFEIRSSFTAYLFLRVRFELYYQRKVDKLVRFVDTDKLVHWREKSGR